MAWTYADWITYGDANRLTRLRLHISEVSAEVGPDLASAPHSVSRGGLIEYLKQLRETEAKLDARTGNSSEFTVARPKDFS